MDTHYTVYRNNSWQITIGFSKEHQNIINLAMMFDQLFCLAEIGDIAVRIGTSGKEPGADHVAWPPSDQGPSDCLVLKRFVLFKSNN